MDEENGVQQEIPPIAEELDVKGKKIKLKPVYVLMALVCGILVCCFLLFNSYNSISSTTRVFDFLNSSYISVSSYNKNYETTKREEQIQSNGSSINIFDFESQKEYKKAKENATTSMNQISQYDEYFKGYYGTLKKEAQAYKNKKSSYYLMNSALKNFNKSVTYDYNRLMSSEFVDPDVKMLFVSRYKILISFLSSHESNFTASSLINDINSLIKEDNVLNLQEYECLKQYLKDNGISYVCENNKIRIT